MKKYGVDILAISALLAILLSTAGCPSGYVGSYAAGVGVASKPGRAGLGYAVEMLADTQLERGLKAEAASSAAIAIAVFDELGPKEKLNLCSCLMTLAFAVKDDPARHAEAIEAFRRVIAMTSTEDAEERSFHATTLGHLGQVYVDDGDVAQAEPLLQRAMALNEAQPDLYDGRAYAKCLHNLGVIRLMQRKMDEADAFFDRAIDVLVKAGDVECREMAMAQNGRAFVLHAAGRQAESKALMEQATTLMEKVEGADSIELAKMRFDLACVHRGLGDLDEARRLCSRSLEVHTQQLGPDNPRTVRVRQTLEKWRNADAV